MNRMIQTLVLAGAATLVHAQAPQFLISTYAGLPIPALSTAIGSPQSITTERIGNVYFTSLNPELPLNYHGRYGVCNLDGNGVLTGSREIQATAPLATVWPRTQCSVSRISTMNQTFPELLSMAAGTFTSPTVETIEFAWNPPYAGRR